MKIKAKLLLVAMLALSLFVAGCSSSSSTNEEESGKVVLKFLHKWPQPEFAPYFEEVVKEFEKQNPDIKIKMEAIADEPIKDKLRVILGGNEVPDIMFSWSGEFARKFVRADAALDLTPYLNEDAAWKDSFIPASLQPFSADGKNYGIPLRFNGKFFIYNKEIFEKYNLEAPKTWDEFLDVLETLKKGGETPIILGNQSPWAAIHYLTGLNQKMVSQDIRMKDYNPGSGEFTDSGYVKAMEMFADLNKKGYLMKDANSSSHDMAKQLFFAGKGAIFYVELEEFADADKNMKGNWGFFPMPSIEDGNGSQNYITGAPDGFIVSSKTKHPEEAIKFLKFLTSKESALKLVEQIGWPSPIDGATNPDTALKEVAEGVDFMKQAEGMAEWLDTDVHAKVADVYLTNIQLLLDGSKSPEAIIKEVQDVAKQVQSEVE
ncbi:raffinose/stachyose/melibiose transport system substrate-binding protein [Neobacillus niacini]|uniref:ABC transporter substrate-binding protein n=1 Tax=Neobacillus driksii TaxID=3035913 RepID=UPI00278907BD|nr:extracellular solute-binding protein [Neobacillus niacini]MDQ0971566.1 raffinose/stachyose/melibiose transport system substrate-binding protein [Neobacillus niacini]